MNHSTTLRKCTTHKLSGTIKFSYGKSFPNRKADLGSFLLRYFFKPAGIPRKTVEITSAFACTDAA